MATRLYWHNAANTLVSNLPTTKQSTQTVSGNGASQSVNKLMNTTIGTTQATITFTGGASTVEYYTRFVTDTIGQSSIAANTWTVRWAFNDQVNADTTANIAIYTYRPGTGKQSTIYDSTMPFTVAAGEVGYVNTISGSAVSGISAGTDVLCLEFMESSVAPVTKTLYFDGTNNSFTNGSTVSSAASYIETPENLTFGVAPGVTATTTSKVVTNKFIAHG